MEQQKLLRQLQLIEKEMLDIFVSICEKENLKYYLYGGTALGAVRHKGFIPWDDDIDVCMPREDYDKFISLANKHLGKDYELQHYTTNEKYSSYTAKIINKKLITNVKFENTIVKRNIWIDIFPLDGAPNNILKRFFHYRKLNKYRLELIFHFINEYDSTKKRKPINNLIIKIAKFIPIGKLLNANKIYKKIDKQLKINDYRNSMYLGSFLGPLREKEMVPKWCYEEGREVIFENSKYIAPKKVEDYLTFTYGDYMTFPPIEDRKPEHYNIVTIENK